MIAAGGESFTTVLISYAISRGILLAQYLVGASVSFPSQLPVVQCSLIVAYMAKSTNRPRRGHFASIITLVVTIILCIIAITLPAHSPHAVIAKVCLTVQRGMMLSSDHPVLPWYRYRGHRWVDTAGSPAACQSGREQGCRALWRVDAHHLVSLVTEMFSLS